MGTSKWVKVDVMLWGGDEDSLWRVLDALDPEAMQVERMVEGGEVVFENREDMIAFALGWEGSQRPDFDAPDLSAFLSSKPALDLDLDVVREVVARTTSGRGVVYPLLYLRAFVADHAAAQALGEMVTKAAAALGCSKDVEIIRPETVTAG